MVGIYVLSNKKLTTIKKEREDNSMKKMFTAALMSLNMVVNANHLNSELSISSRDHSMIAVAVDQMWMGTPQCNVDAENITPGNHWINIAKYDVYNAMQPIIVFSGYVYIPEQSKVVAMISCSNRFRILQVLPIAPPSCVYEQEYNNNNYNYNNQPCIISDYDFNLLRNSIESKSFDSTKLEIAKQAVNNYHFSAAQVAQLMRLFTFESDKLEFAKYAYHKTIDKNRYFILNDEFTFSSSISELNSYLQNEQG
jgi:hypothetical protein